MPWVFYLKALQTQLQDFKRKIPIQLQQNGRSMLYIDLKTTRSSFSDRITAADFLPHRALHPRSRAVKSPRLSHQWARIPAVGVALRKPSCYKVLVQHFSCFLAGSIYWFLVRDICATSALSRRTLSTINIWASRLGFGAFTRVVKLLAHHRPGGHKNGAGGRDGWPEPW